MERTQITAYIAGAALVAASLFGAVAVAQGDDLAAAEAPVMGSSAESAVVVDRTLDSLPADSVQESEGVTALLATSYDEHEAEEYEEADYEGEEYESEEFEEDHDEEEEDDD